MATYSNPHWLLSHIRNSFISTDETGLCEMVMASDDLPKHYMKRYQGSVVRAPVRNPVKQESGGGGIGRRKPTTTQRRSLDAELAACIRNPDAPVQVSDLICYPGLDQSDDEDMDLAAHSLDIQMYPDIGAHRYRSNTAQKLEKMDIARRRAARTKCVIYDDELVEPQCSDFFERKEVKGSNNCSRGDDKDDDELQQDASPIQKKTWKSKLALELANSPKAIPNKFQDYAKFDGTSLTGVPTKRIRIFLSMLPDKEKNYPIKICALASARIQEIIGLICYKATLQFPNLLLKSVDNYGLYMTEDNDDLEDFPPLDNNEPFAKFGFSHLTLAERRSSNLSLNKMDEEEEGQHLPTSTHNKDDKDSEKIRNLTGLVQSFSAMSTSTQEGGCGGMDLLKQTSKMDVINANRSEAGFEGQVDDLEQRLMNQDDMLEAQLFRTFNVNIIDKRFFKTEVTLNVSGDHVEIGQYKHTKFWSKQKAINYPIDAVAFCEIVERRTIKAILRIWLQSAASTVSASSTSSPSVSGVHGDNQQQNTTNNSPIHLLVDLNSSNANNNSFSYQNQQQQQQQQLQQQQSHQHKTSFSLFNSTHGILNLSTAGCQSLQIQKRFKHYDFEASLPTIEQIHKKLDCILMMRNSDLRQEFLQYRSNKFEKLTGRRTQGGRM